jgi:hypothetical protein
VKLALDGDSLEVTAISSEEQDRLVELSIARNATPCGAVTVANLTGAALSVIGGMNELLVGHAYEQSDKISPLSATGSMRSTSAMITSALTTADRHDRIPKHSPASGPSASGAGKPPAGRTELLTSARGRWPAGLDGAGQNGS